MYFSGCGENLFTQVLGVGYWLSLWGEKRQTITQKDSTSFFFCTAIMHKHNSTRSFVNNTEPCQIRTLFSADTLLSDHSLCTDRYGGEFRCPGLTGFTIVCRFGVVFCVV